MPSKSATLEIPTRESAKYEAAIDEYIAKIDRSLERNKRTQARIDKLEAETRVISTRVRSRLKRICGKSF